MCNKKNNRLYELAVAFLLLLLIGAADTAIAQDMEGENPFKVCEEAASSWDKRSRTYSIDVIESATTHNGIYFCIVRGMKHMPEYSVPVHLKITYNLEAGAMTVKKWGW